jgi:uncharacterized protein (DUF2141 family)
VLSSGKVNCWGYGVYGQLGNEVDRGSNVPMEVQGISNATQVSAGLDFACAALSSGKVKCWGANTGYGQLGNNSDTSTSVPVEVEGITTAIKVGTGSVTGCALLSSGKVDCWGDNSYGELGNNSTVRSKVPVEVQGITTARQIWVGAGDACAILASGKANCWGDNSYGELGNNSTVLSSVPVEVSNVSTFVTFESLLVAAPPADTTAPVAPGSFTGVPSSPTSSASATIGFTLGESGGTVECRVDSGSWGACTSVSGTTGSKAVTGLADGSHTVSVRQTDAASNVSPVGTTSSWTVDATAPSTPASFSGVPSSPTSSTSATISFVLGESGGTVECRVDSGSWGACTSVSGTTGSRTLSGLPVGAHTVSVRQTDAAGNVSQVGTTASWTVAAADTTAPVAPGSFTGVPSSPTNQTGATISFVLGESGGTVECRVDSGSWGACTSVSGTTGSKAVTGLADGSHTVSVRQTDAASNVSPVGTTSSWTVDTVAPSAPVLSGAPSGFTSLTTASISFSGEVGAVFTCSLDGGAYSACISPASLTGLSVGSHSFAVKATDAAGNASQEASVTWLVSAPVLPFSAPTILTPAAGTKTVYKTSVSGKSTWAMKLGLLFSTGGDSRDGAQILTVQVAVDSAGKPVSTKPSDSQALPTAASFIQGVVAWDASGEVTRSTMDAPVWVRVGNRVGKWSGWVKLTA